MPAASQSKSPAEQRFVRAAMAAPMLEQAHEQHLARAWREQNDEAALHELTSAYMRLVIAMAARFKHYGLPMADLVSEGNVGLMMAAARFEASRDVRFSTYASWWIRSQIQDYVLRNWSIVRTGTTAAQKSLFFNLRRLRAKIGDLSETGINAEHKAWIATHLGVPERDVDQMASRLSVGDRSLNAPLTQDGDGEWQDLLADDAPQPEAIVMHAHDTERRREWLGAALATLNARELHIISKRRLEEDAMTLEALGAELGVSKERVRQIEHQALSKLKRALEAIAGDVAASGLVP